MVWEYGKTFPSLMFEGDDVYAGMRPSDMLLLLERHGPVAADARHLLLWVGA